MRLLFDQNLSPRLCGLLARLYPGSAHVRSFNLQSAPDEVIWAFARDHKYVIVSKDEDFHQRSFLYGHPPKVIWVRLGNCGTDRVANVLEARVSEVLAFDADDEASFLILSDHA